MYAVINAGQNLNINHLCFDCTQHVFLLDIKYKGIDLHNNKIKEIKKKTETIGK